MDRKFALFILITFCFVVQGRAQNADKKDMQHFMDNRFGMFIHFGPVTLRGTEIGWSRGKQVPFDEYDQLYKEFNPALFNADAWVRAAKNAGMKYLTVTAKHHDGFCLWPTAYSDYNISNSPFKRDLVKELAMACKRQGIDFCIYFTVLDWHDNDYPIHHNGPNTKGDMRVFVNRMKNELGELIDNYHPKMLWFDGFWEEPWTNQYGREVYEYIKKKDPHVLVNNRLGKDGNTVQGKVVEKLNAESVGDFLTPEQRIGELNMNSPWESCITICTQWAWKPNDKMKSLKECIQTLARTAGGNGNLLFNVGPMMDGRIEERQVKRLEEMGDWLKKYGSSIYKTNGGPYMPNDIYSSTRLGNKIYIHVYNAANELTLPPFPDNTKVEKCYLLNGSVLGFDQNPSSSINIKLPAILPDENCSVIVLEINHLAIEIPVIAKK